MVTAYATLANGGFKVDPWFIEQISTETDGVLYRAKPAEACPDCGALISEAEQPENRAPRVLDERIAFIMNSMLRSVVEEGSGNRVQRDLRRSDLMGKPAQLMDHRNSGFPASTGTSPRLCSWALISLSRLASGSRERR